MTLPTQATAPHCGDLPYRTSVGIMLLNGEGRVWTGRRLARLSETRSSHVWQMPQGGIGRGEEPLEAALRELEEETGVRSVDVLAELPRWLTYDLPAGLLGIALKGKYRGQRQRWFAMRFWGDDSEIDISPRGAGKAEFDRWAWRPPQDLSQLIVHYKRAVYETVIAEFAPLARPAASMEADAASYRADPWHDTL
jgi:putative (di)nucleoside polyphosphate hydrolase